MKLKYIEEVRAFSRFYTVFFGILDKRFLKSRFSLLETRVMHCAYTKEGILPSEIVAELNIDKGFLSRILVSLEKRKVIKRVQSKKDGRSVQMFITTLGKKEFKKLTKDSNNEVAGLLSNLSNAQCEILVRKMNEIKQLLSEG